ncbi:chitin synthase-domain-containing protein [Gilbertella persicaria]|uniref:chitin synthase-domain-containing protein n=1 Tax=Gilbertella persicaria TaxID=101096 RepID=UPI00221F9010|nr:chitin synthase-domain-containing protein [Gilbertella persicaria]KAI8090143.1 chitin synthase-domain-containing protein [Gilbertella persicaria]
MSVNDYSYSYRPTCRRLVWLSLSRLLTLLVPDFVLHHVGGMTSPAMRIAWREKIALLFLFLLSSAFFCFWLEYVSMYFCDPERIYDYDLVFSNDSKFSAINGKVVDWRHVSNNPMVDFVNNYSHHDLSANFPRFMMLSRTTTNTPYSDSIINDCVYYQNRASAADAWLNYLLSIDDGYVYDKASKTLLECPVPNHPNITGAPCFYSSDYNSLFYDLPIKGDIQYDPSVVQSSYNALPSATNYTRQAYVILDGYVLDVTAYLRGATTVIPISSTVSSRSFALDRMFLPLDLTIFLYINLGKDISDYFDGNVTESPTLYRQCLVHLFKKGIVPSHVSSGCAQINPALWATMGAGLVYFIIRASLTYISRVSFVQRFLFSPIPENTSVTLYHQWPYTVLLVPCFAESFDTLKMTVDSLSRSTYEDSKKLLLFVCDGITTSAQEQKHTHDLLLEYLGYSCKDDPLCHPYTSLGQNKKKINHARVYSGFYETGRNRVPYLIIVKIGQPQEETDYYQSHMSTAPPGNRGKRDSIVLVLGFFERCMNLANNRLTPLEYEIFNQCYNVLGIDPRQLKYMMVTDADIQVQSDVVQKLVSRLEGDKRMLAVSGHVRPANPEQNLITMLQIFPVYLSFYSGLAYEACMRSVMTITGGLVMYKLWTENKPQPLDDKSIKRYKLSKQQNPRRPSPISKWPKISDEIIVTNPFSGSRTSSLTNDTVTTITTITTTATNRHPSQRQRVHSKGLSSFESTQRSSTRPESRLSLSPSLDVQLCCAHPTVLRSLAVLQADTMHMQNVLLLGEERVLSLVLLKSHPNHRLGFEPEAIGYATLPTSLFSLQGQQIRRLRSAFHTQLEIQRIAWQLGFTYWLLSTTELIDIVFSMPVILYLYNIFGRSLEKLGLSYFIIACSFLGLAVLHIIFFLLRRQFRYVLWFMLYCVISLPLFHVYFPLLAIWQSNYSEYWYDVWPTAAGRRSRLHGLVDHTVTQKPQNNQAVLPEKLPKDTIPSQKTSRQSAYALQKPLGEHGEEAVPRMRLSEYEVFEAKRLHQAAEAALDSKFADFTGFAHEGLNESQLVESLVTSPPLAQVREGVHSTRNIGNYRPSSVELYDFKHRYPNNRFDDKPDSPISNPSPRVEQENPFDDSYSIIVRDYSEENNRARHQHRPTYSQSSYLTNSSDNYYALKQNTFHHNLDLDGIATLPTSLNSSGFAKTPNTESLLVDEILQADQAEEAYAQDDRTSTLSISSNTFSIRSPEDHNSSTFVPRHRIGNYDSKASFPEDHLHEGRHRAVHNLTTLQQHGSHAKLRQQFENHATMRMNLMLKPKKPKKIPAMPSSSSLSRHYYETPKSNLITNDMNLAQVQGTIKAEIHDYLQVVDLESTTRAQVKAHLIEHFGPQRINENDEELMNFVNICIEEITFSFLNPIE